MYDTTLTATSHSPNASQSGNAYPSQTQEMQGSNHYAQGQQQEHHGQSASYYAPPTGNHQQYGAPAGPPPPMQESNYAPPSFPAPSYKK